MQGPADRPPRRSRSNRQRHEDGGGRPTPQAPPPAAPDMGYLDPEPGPEHFPDRTGPAPNRTGPRRTGLHRTGTGPRREASRARIPGVPSAGCSQALRQQ
ncbi:hypothetical protein GCM10010254_35560 [Streptomyces chromofuscus]|nr:hypothetical protein GCM10010254_35560 [Streptomyces chromofuscus]